MSKPPAAIKLPSMLAPFKGAVDVLRVACHLNAMAAQRRAEERAASAECRARTDRYVLVLN